MTRAGVVVLALAVATGCTMSASSRRGTMAAGAVLTVGGMLLVRASEVDADGDGRNETVLDDDPGMYLPGSLMVISGIVLLLTAFASDTPSEHPAAVVVTPPAPAPAVSEAPAMPAPEVPALEVPAPEVGKPPHETTVQRIPAAPLPEIPASPEVDALARKVRSASAYGHCDAAWIMWTDLAKLDPAYARALRDGQVMARCVEPCCPRVLLGP